MRAVELTAQFGIAGILDFEETGDGLAKAAISLDGMAGELYLQGAQLTAWQLPNERPVLFTSPRSAFAPGRAIRGGIPIIFPWFGPSRYGPAAPQHGFARTAMWHLDGVETAGRESLTLTLSLGDSDVSSPFWPEPFRAIYTVTFARTLSLRLAVQNRAMHPILFEEALHTYFAVSDITAIAISGLTGTTYIDKTEAGRRKPQTAALVTLRAETDRVYLDTPARCVLEDRGWRRQIVIEKVSARSLPSCLSVPQVDAAGTSNSTNVRLTRQKPSLFQWLAVPLWVPTGKIVCQQIRGIPFECSAIRRPASSPALGGLVHELTNTYRL